MRLKETVQPDSVDAEQRDDNRRGRDGPDDAAQGGVREEPHDGVHDEREQRDACVAARGLVRGTSRAGACVMWCRERTDAADEDPREQLHRARAGEQERESGNEKEAVKQSLAHAKKKAESKRQVQARWQKGSPRQHSQHVSGRSTRSTSTRHASRRGRYDFTEKNLPFGNLLFFSITPFHPLDAASFHTSVS